MQMIALSVSFKNSPLHFREKISFSEHDLKKALIKLSFDDNLKEIVILSTCNRTEFYAITDNLAEAYNTIMNFISNEKFLDKKELSEYLNIFYNKFASEHLYKVASGLDSLVFGENEILAQVKKSFFIAQNNGTTSKIFNSLFKSVIECGKRVRTETKISHGNTSFASIILKIIKNKFYDISKINVLLIGLGDIGKTTSKNLKSIGINNLVLTNRTIEKAIELSKEINSSFIEIENIYKELNKFDVIITCTASQNFILDIKNTNPIKDLLLIDISIPRNINPKLSENSLIELYDIDLLQKEIDINIEERKKLLANSEYIIEEEMNKFIQWYNNFEVIPIISSLTSFLDDIKTSEIDKAIKKFDLSEEQIKILNTVTKSITNKILHYPIINIKAEEDRNRKEEYTKSLKYLFQLDNQDIYEKYFRKTENKHQFKSKKYEKN